MNPSRTRRLGAARSPEETVGLNALRSAATTLAVKKTFRSRCVLDLNKLGVTPDQVRAAAAEASLLDGVDSTVPLASLYSSQPRVARLVQGTIGDALAQPGTVAVAEIGGHHIYVIPGAFKLGDFFINVGTVFHEILHNITGRTDGEIEYALGINPEGNRSHSITMLLIRDCL